jgi:uncharacterized protein YndB with AHSA1/START domain
VNLPISTAPGSKPGLVTLRSVLTWVLGALALGVALIAGTGLILSNRWAVKQDVLIAAPIERVFELVADLQSWNRWEASNDDASVHFSYEPTPFGPNTLRRFAGKAGNTGATQVVALNRPAQLELESQLGAAKDKAHAAFTFVTENGLTRVSWNDSGTLPRITGAYLRDSVEQRLNYHMSESLKRLKALAENGTK